MLIRAVQLLNYSAFYTMNILTLSARERLYTSAFDVYRRQMLTYQDGPRTGRNKILIIWPYSNEAERAFFGLIGHIELCSQHSFCFTKSLMPRIRYGCIFKNPFKLRNFRLDQLILMIGGGGGQVSHTSTWSMYADTCTNITDNVHAG